MKRKTFLLFFLIIISIAGKGQNNGDYESHQSGSWSDRNSWKKYVGGSWIYPAPDAPPSGQFGNLTSTVTIKANDTITATQQVGGSSMGHGAIIIEDSAVLDMKQWYIAGYPTMPPTRFPSLVINGHLYTTNHVTVNNFSIGNKGYFKTAYSGTEGWYSSSISPGSISINGTVEYNRQGDQSIVGTSYKNLILSGSGKKTLTAHATVNDSLKINPGVTFKINGKSLTIIGDLLNNGTISDTVTGSVIFNGLHQSIDGSGIFFFPSLTFSNGGIKTLKSDITVSGLLTINIAELDINGQNLTIIGSGITNNGNLIDNSTEQGNVIFQGANQFISGGGDYFFPNLTIAGTGNKNLNSSQITLYGLLNILPGNNFIITEGVGDKYLFLLGDGIENNGTFTVTDNETIIYFDGSEQLVSGSGNFNGTIWISAFGLLNPTSKIRLNNQSVIRTINFYIVSDLIMGSESKVEIINGGSFDLFKAGGLVLESSDSSTASLINYGNLGDWSGFEPATAERYLTADKWHIISPILANQDISDFLENEENKIPFKDPYYAMTDYLENKEDGSGSGGWNDYYTSSTSGIMESGKGYLLRRSEEDGTVKITGDLIFGNHSVNIIRTNNGWNCIGNPYTSSIAIRSNASAADNFLDTNADEMDPSYAALYIYDPDNPDVYHIINNTDAGGRVISQDYLQPGQGFIIRAKEGGGEINFKQSMQAHQNGQKFYKKSGSSFWPYINLNVKSNGKSASTTILFNRNMSRGLDVTYDAGLFGGDPALKIYTRLVEDNGVNFAIQCLPDFETEEMIVPIGVDVPAGGVLTFSAETFSLPLGYKAVLEDRQQGIFTNIEQRGTEYAALSSAGTKGSGRFYLHLTGAVTDVNITPDNQKINIFSYGKEIYIQGNLNENVIVRIYDISGKMVKTQRLDYGIININVIRADELKSGIYFVKLESKEKLETAKIFLE